MKSLKQINRQKIHNRIRKKISGSEHCPRFSCYKSNTAVYAQVTDDTKGHTLVAGSTRKWKNKNKANTAKLGEEIAESVKEANIKQVVYDRSGYRYHGLVKNLFDAFRQKLAEE